LQEEGFSFIFGQTLLMSPRSLFNIILKVIGILFVKDVLVLIPQLFSGFLYLTRSDGSAEALWIFFNTIAILALYALIIVYFTLKTDWVIDKFELTEGIPEDNLALNVHRSTVLNITLFLIGIFILSTAVPYFCTNVFGYFQEKRLTYGMTNPKPTNIILYGIEIILSLLLIIYRRPIVNFIELQRKK
jgi:hypothetical protein